MASIEKTNIQLKDNDGKTAAGLLFTTCYAAGDRLKRALLRLLGFWLAAGLAVFIPIAHFVLVPGFLIAGPVLAYLTYQQKQARDHAEGQCPVCQAEVNIKLEAKDEIPKWSYCPACNASLEITDA